MTHTNDVKTELLDSAQRLMGGRGFSAVGLNDILSAVKVPKGSFYHYFASKEAFGEALLQRYFDGYLAMMDDFFSTPDLSGRERLLLYWRNWLATQTTTDLQSKCLVVKLAAEVADLSDSMRAVLLTGTQRIVKRLSSAIEEGVRDGSLEVSETPEHLAEQLYHLWLGASVVAKITKDDAPLQAAMRTTLTGLRSE